MPKIKTHSGAKKRFKTTKSGKVKRAHAYTSHILTKKSTKRKRNLRKTAVADVTIKEQRTLVLAARETPLSAIHLRNLSELATIPGVRIIPPMMTFYHQPENIEEMTYHIAAKLVEPFGIEAREYRRWTGLV